MSDGNQTIFNHSATITIGVRELPRLLRFGVHEGSAMVFLYRLLTEKRPRLRASERADVSVDGPNRDSYRVVVRSRAILSPRGRLIGPTFMTGEQAQKFADWCNGAIKNFK